MTDPNFYPLDIGAVGDQVLAIQRHVGVPETGWYDNITAAGVANFQYRSWLPRTGKFDAATDAKMFPQLTEVPLLPLTGMLDSETVIALQLRLGIKQDGFMGSDTVTAMEAAGLGALVQYQYSNVWVAEVSRLQKSLSLGTSLSPESEEANVQ